MHIDNLPISSVPTYRRRDDDECISVRKVPYASFVLCAVAIVCEEVEFQRLREGNNDE